jgi:hypothetical protein
MLQLTPQSRVFLPTFRTSILPFFVISWTEKSICWASDIRFDFFSRTPVSVFLSSLTQSADARAVT